MLSLYELQVVFFYSNLTSKVAFLSLCDCSFRDRHQHNIETGSAKLNLAPFQQNNNQRNMEKNNTFICWLIVLGIVAFLFNIC